MGRVSVSVLLGLMMLSSAAMGLNVLNIIDPFTPNLRFFDRNCNKALFAGNSTNFCTEADSFAVDPSAPVLGGDTDNRDVVYTMFVPSGATNDGLSGSSVLIQIVPFDPYYNLEARFIITFGQTASWITIDYDGSDGVPAEGTNTDIDIGSEPPSNNLMNSDFFVEDNAIGFQVTATGDHDAILDFQFFPFGDPSPHVSTFNYLTAAGLTTHTDTWSNFGVVSDFDSIGALRISIESDTALDFEMFNFETFNYVITGEVYDDCTNDGTRNNGESGVPFEEVNLFICGNGPNGAVLDSTLTDAVGDFEFGVEEGCYDVCFSDNTINLTEPSPMSASPRCYTTIVIEEGGMETSTDNDFGIEPTTTITCPPPATVDCSNRNPTTGQTGNAAVVSCSGTITSSFTDGAPDGFCSGDSFIRTFTTSDSSASCTQTISFTDNQGPTASNVPGFESYECNEAIVNEQPTWTDNCNTVVGETFTDSVAPGCGNTQTITRTYTASDICGNPNQGNVQSTIQVVDTTPPTINAPPDQSVDCTAAPFAPVTSATGSDTCGSFTLSDISYTDSVLSNGCPATFLRTWFGEDDCGNTANTSNTVTVTDNVAPVVTAPADPAQPFDCNDNTATGPATATDACSAVFGEQPTLTGFTEINPVTSVCTTTVTRRFTAVDACGNQGFDDQEVVVTDDTTPILSLPADVNVECSEPDISPGMANTGTATATDTCITGPLTVTFTDVRVTVDACTDRVTRTFTASDNCGSPASGDQIITIVDTLGPSIVNAPEDATLDCLQFPTALADTMNTNGVATGSDECNNGFNPTFVDSNPTSDGCTETVTRTWTATDDCGNNSNVFPSFVSDTQTITFEDTTPATGTFPADVTLECGDNTAAGAANPAGTATATDDCRVPFVSPPVDVPDANNDSCDQTFSRTWSVSDNCNAAVTSVQTITVRDTIAPTVDAPVDGQQVDVCAPCLSADALCLGAPITSDCQAQADLTVTFSDVPNPVDNFVCQTITRTFTVLDNCGQSNTDTQVFELVSSPPQPDPASAVITLECTGPNTNTSPAETGMVTFSGCNVVSETFMDVPSTPFEPCEETYTRTWTATNSCGQTAQFTQTISVLDRTNPTFNVFPTDRSVDCGAVGQSTNPVFTGTPTGSDVCQELNVNFTFTDSTNTAGCTDVITRTWIVDDGCGNSVSSIQTVTVTDNDDPTITAPMDVEVDCVRGFTLSQYNSGDAVASDTCSTPFVSSSDGPLSGDVCDPTFVRTFRATDGCGNFAEDTQVVTVGDNTPPMANFPTSRTTDCSTATDSFTLGQATGSDECSGPTVSSMDTVVTGCTGESTITRTWTVSDGCNNVSSVQTIIFDDTTGPVFNPFPSTQTLECGDDPNVAGNAPTATDDCSSASVAVVQSLTQRNENPVDPCTDTFDRVWITADACGNQSTLNVVVTIDDTEAPTITTTPPATVEIDCQATAPEIGAASDCTTVIIDVTNSNPTGSCEQTFTRTYLFRDGCGNSVQALSQITLTDTTDPTISNVPANILVGCLDDNSVGAPGFEAPTVNDNCDPSPTLTFNDVESNEMCPNDEVITRTFTGMDWCGRTVTATQVITIEIDELPVVTAPADVPVECLTSSDSLNLGSATAFSPCGVPVTITFSDSTNGQTCPEIITRTWTASDGCMNTGVDTQLITLDDTIDPFWNCFPEDYVTTCDLPFDPSVAGTPCAGDACDGPICMITFVDSQPVEQPSVGTCPGNLVIQRMWTAQDFCGNTLTTNQEITVLFSAPAEDCPQEDCPQEPCTLAECPVVSCDCCALGGVTSCNAVPCNAVPCTAVPCTAVDCTPCDNGGSTVSPIPSCGSDTPCVPNFNFIKRDDDDDDDDQSFNAGGQNVGVQIVIDDDDDNSAASMLLSVFAVLFAIFAML